MIYRLPGIIFQIIIDVGAFLGYSRALDWKKARQRPIKYSNFDIWIHASSLGEYWMVHNLIRDFEKKGKKVFVSIFSPSAWEIVSKNEKYCGFIPIDRQKEIHHFVETINPKFVVIAKYDLWPVLSNVLYNKKIPYVIAFSQFHEHHHTLWKWNFLENKIYRRALGVGHQTQKSLKLWQKSNFSNGFFCGDGRFDSIYHFRKKWTPLDEIDVFKGESKLFVLGSSWPREESMTIPLIPKLSEVKFVIAPHRHQRASEIIKILDVPYILMSEINIYDKQELIKSRVLIVDTMGQLKNIYGHSDFTFIGGGFQNGLHNILEALIFGNIITFGPKIKGHWEASECKADVLGINSDSETLMQWLSNLIDLDEKSLKQKISSGQDFVNKNIGATERVMKFIGTNIN